MLHVTHRLEYSRAHQRGLSWNFQRVFDNRRLLELTRDLYRLTTLCAEPPRARVMVASAKAAGFSENIRITSA
jgi:hypothetical protein